jgi:hypothetical protein
VEVHRHNRIHKVTCPIGNSSSLLFAIGNAISSFVEMVESVQEEF